MGIRKRISDPYSEETKRVDRRLREGAPPVAPPKPSLVQREKFVLALSKVPVGQTFKSGKFFREYADKWMQGKWDIWGQTLYILPGYKLGTDGSVFCTHPTVGRHNCNKRGIKPMLRLKGEQRTWYSQVIHWIDETVWDY